MSRLAFALTLALAWSVPATAQYTISNGTFSSGFTSASGGSYSLKATVGQPIVGEVSGGSYVLCQGFWCSAGAAEAVQLALSVMLGGAYDSGADAMRTALLDGGVLPSTQPYGDAAYAGTPRAYAGSEAVTTLPPDAVDWVVLEVRSSPAATDSVTSVAALVLTDGTVVGPSGTAAPGVPGLAPGNYYVVVRHRNHVPAMTASAIALGDGSVAYDLTAPGAAYGTEGRLELRAGLWGLWPADGAPDGLVTAPDFNLYSSKTSAGATGYDDADYTLDGLVTAPDFNVFSSATAAGASSSVPEN